ncbi:MAG: hypothetical protein PHV68_01955 [Candidatus Gastranaerophilales bacterium]|nr:hypothetical protein [Candidatus Gastranaerophilales bacterium]
MFKALDEKLKKRFAVIPYTNNPTDRSLYYFAQNLNIVGSNYLASQVPVRFSMNFIIRYNKPSYPEIYETMAKDLVAFLSIVSDYSDCGIENVAISDEPFIGDSPGFSELIIPGIIELKIENQEVT